MDKAVIRGTFSDYKLIKSRKVVQIIVEVPVEQQAQVFAALGFPMPDSETWVAVARLLDPEAAKRAPAAPEKPRKRFHELPLSQQAGIRCQDGEFYGFLCSRFMPIMSGIKGTTDGDVAADFVRGYCAIDSRSRLDVEDGGSGQKWRKLNAEFEEWAGLTAEAR